MSQCKTRAKYFDYVQYTGNNDDEIKKFLGKSYCGEFELGDDSRCVVALGLYGFFGIEVGDYILKNRYGDFEACYSSAFEREYELI